MLIGLKHEKNNSVNFFKGILRTSVLFRYMDRAKIEARTQAKQKEMKRRVFLSKFLGTQNTRTLTTKARGDGKGERGGGIHYVSAYTKYLYLPGVVPVTRPDGGA